MSQIIIDIADNANVQDIQQMMFSITEEHKHWINSIRMKLE